MARSRVLLPDMLEPLTTSSAVPGGVQGNVVRHSLGGREQGVDQRLGLKDRAVATSDIWEWVGGALVGVAGQTVQGLELAQGVQPAAQGGTVVRAPGFDGEGALGGP